MKSVAVESNKLAEENIGFAIAIAIRFSRLFHAADPEEIDCDAKLGLVKAASNFSAARGVKFTTYAWPFIIGEICKGVRARSCDVQFLSEADPDSVRAVVDHAVESPLEAVEAMDDVSFIRNHLGSERYERASDDRLTVAALSAGLGISRSAAAQRIKRARKIIFDQQTFASTN